MTNRIELYGIKNCDSVKKARRWLEQHSLDHQFTDVRENGLTEAVIIDWLNRCNVAQLVNRRSTSWKSLTGTDKASINDLLEQLENDKSAKPKQQLAKFLTANLLLIKRPVTVTAKADILIGFSEQEYQGAFL